MSNILEEMQTQAMREKAAETVGNLGNDAYTRGLEICAGVGVASISLDLVWQLMSGMASTPVAALAILASPFLATVFAEDASAGRGNLEALHKASHTLINSLGEKKVGKVAFASILMLLAMLPAAGILWGIAAVLFTVMQSEIAHVVFLLLTVLLCLLSLKTFAHVRTMRKIFLSEQRQLSN